MTRDPWTTLRICQVYDNPWIEVTHRDVLNPSGGNGIYGVVRFKHVAVGIVPVDAEGYTWLVGQFRYTLGRYSWEIPEGGAPLNTPPLESAKRELLEETGIQAKKWMQLLELHLSNSVTTEYGVAYVAQDLEFHSAQPEETEELQLRRIPLETAFEMVLRGEITDALSVAALLKTKELLRLGNLSV
ncbi:MAG: NUDIX hydrolase [Bacteroidetes bacterium]|nr:MAG: NUDIX hydrolase [Bacteroidota bacterium]